MQTKYYIDKISVILKIMDIVNENCICGFFLNYLIFPNEFDFPII